MNGLSLRISGGGRKPKNTLGFLPISFPQDAVQVYSKDNKYQKFLESTDADNQLTFLKGMLSENCEYVRENSGIKFLVVVYLYAEAKHPVKCFLSRYITRNNQIQDDFCEQLTEMIKGMIEHKCTEPKDYLDVLMKIAPCVENFPPGAVAIHNLQTQLVIYMKNCLNCCINTLW
ncbi:unnamed protein product [Leptidea sinapis]|uniref:Uncharacterized protein n=1 Tax=Leptidea sinapis TaxID=189913 RepID=A0A5E4PRV0_9NEOP|nr:unnamed protein product [Leptidea sinapis]